MEYYKNKYLKYKNKYLDMVGGDFKPKHIPKTKDMFASIDKYNSFMKKMKGGNGPTKEEREEFEQMNIKSVGLGTYGCVYAPSLPCRDDHGNPIHNTPNTIGKLMTKKDAAAEVNKWDLIKNIPGIEKYVATFQGTCKPTELAMEKIKPKNSHYCGADHVKVAVEKAMQTQDPVQDEAAAEPRSKMRAIERDAIENVADLDILLYENAGLNNLEETIYISANYPMFNGIKNFIIKFKNIMDGVLLLNSKGIIHGDIKMNNIQVKKDVYKLIDFGRAFDINDPDFIVHPDINMPLDVLAISSMVKPPRYKTFVQTLIKLFYRASPMSENLTTYLNSRNLYKTDGGYIDNYSEYVHYLKNGIDEKIEGFTKQKLAEKIDVYSLGLILFAALYFFQIYKYTADEKIVNINKSSVPPGFEQVCGNLYSLIIKMTMLDVFGRITITDACSEYDKIYNFLHESNFRYDIYN
jgi:hypothetical protein